MVKCINIKVQENGGQVSQFPLLIYVQTTTPPMIAAATLACPAATKSKENNALHLKSYNAKQNDQSSTSQVQ